MSNEPTLTTATPPTLHLGSHVLFSGEDVDNALQKNELRSKLRKIWRQEKYGIMIAESTRHGQTPSPDREEYKAKEEQALRSLKDLTDDEDQPNYQATAPRKLARSRTHRGRKQAPTKVQAGPTLSRKASRRKSAISGGITKRNIVTRSMTRHLRHQR